MFELREVEIKHLDELLIKTGRANLSGLGGVGKTQLALEFLHRNLGRYSDGAFWLRGETASTLQGDFAALSWLPQLELETRHDPDQERVIESVRTWLRDRRSWLLVVDNVDEGSIAAIEQILGKGLQGHVIITSRPEFWEASLLPVDPMSSADAVTFLLDRTGQADRVAATEIAEILEGLPLALVQAAGYVHETGRDLASYVRLLRSRLNDMMLEGKPADYPQPVALTWRVSFDRIAEKDQSAAAVLKLCAFLASDNISVQLIHDGANLLPAELAASDEVQLDRAFSTLRRYRLVDRQEDRVRIHRLVQAMILESLNDEQRNRWRSAAVGLLERAFPEDVKDPTQWQLCARLYPHALAALGSSVGDRLTLRILRGSSADDVHETIRALEPAAELPPKEAALLNRVEDYLLTVLHKEVEDLLDSLSPRERRVLQLRYGLIDGRQWTTEEVGRRFGVTAERIYEIEELAIRKLRHPSRTWTLTEALQQLDPKILS
jgi:RNA polymerase sigma factor (sigma-70 family)